MNPCTCPQWCCALFARSFHMHRTSEFTAARGGDAAFCQITLDTCSWFLAPGLCLRASVCDRLNVNRWMDEYVSLHQPATSTTHDDNKDDDDNHSNDDNCNYNCHYDSQVLTRLIRWRATCKQHSLDQTVQTHS